MVIPEEGNDRRLSFYFSFFRQENYKQMLSETKKKAQEDGRERSLRSSANLAGGHRAWMLQDSFSREYGKTGD